MPHQADTSGQRGVAILSKSILEAINRMIGGVPCTEICLSASPFRVGVIYPSLDDSLCCFQTKCCGEGFPHTQGCVSTSPQTLALLGHFLFACHQGCIGVLRQVDPFPREFPWVEGCLGWTTYTAGASGYVL